MINSLKDRHNIHTHAEIKYLMNVFIVKELLIILPSIRQIPFTYHL